MPSIQVAILEGRSVEVKRAYFKALTDVSVECLGCKPESVSIVLTELPFEHYARGGKMKADELAEAGLSVDEYHARESGKNR
jgi:Uncharacterized protein, 4-oxalocrotonate tautomerase homolog